MLKIVEFIKANENWLELLSAPPYSLKIKEKGMLVLFNYNQIESDPSNEITREARGLILEKGTWNVVRCGFFRFFNLDEANADTIEWASATATRKEDGTLIFVYSYDNEWHVGTRSTFDAEEAPIQYPNYKSFKDLFDDVATQVGFDFSKLNPNHTTCLELCANANRIVVSYDKPQLFHILTRDNSTLEELDVNIGLPKPAQYILENEQDYRDLVNSFDSNTEGIVIKDAKNHRVKLKTLKYFELHRSINNHNVSVEYALELIRTGEDVEFLTYFEEYTPFFEKIRKKWKEVQNNVVTIQIIVNAWKKNFPDATRKIFSDFVKNMVPPSVLWYKAYEDKAQEWFEGLPTTKIISIFGIGED